MKLRYIGIDFDGTLITDGQYPAISALRPYAKETIAYLKEQGYVLVLWTCRTGANLRDALEFLENNDIEFDYVNENPKELQELYGNDPRKLGVDVFIDDRNFSLGEPKVDWLLVKLVAEMKWEAQTLDEYVQR